MQPNIFSLSKTTWSGTIGKALTELDVAVVLCIKLIMKAPITHNTVPPILTLLYIQLSFTFSILNNVKFKTHKLKL